MSIEKELKPDDMNRLYLERMRNIICVDILMVKNMDAFVCCNFYCAAEP